MLRYLAILTELLRYGICRDFDTGLSLTEERLHARESPQQTAVATSVAATAARHDGRVVMRTWNLEELERPKEPSQGTNF